MLTLEKSQQRFIDAAKAKLGIPPGTGSPEGDQW